MARQLKKKPTRAWAMFGSGNYPMPWTCRHSKSDCIKDFSGGDPVAWLRLKRYYRCEKVTITGATP